MSVSTSSSFFPSGPISGLAGDVFASLTYRRPIVDTARFIETFPTDDHDLFDRKCIEASKNPSLIASAGIACTYLGLYRALGSGAFLDRVQNGASNAVYNSVMTTHGAGTSCKNSSRITTSNVLRSFVLSYYATSMRISSAIGGSANVANGATASSSGSVFTALPTGPELAALSQRMGAIARSLTRQTLAVGPSLLAIYVYGLYSNRQLIQSFVQDRGTRLSVECAQRYQKIAPEDFQAMMEEN
ncbi:unnamed protein product [Amoebophrya sp. A25]|nr:unnamed protein product [Amoebophrya sp. A25]|eukprot:GSA25T00017717001.1